MMNFNKIVWFVFAVVLMVSTNFLSYAENAKTTTNKDCQIAQRGCCSHHGGVCGCSHGRASCCDGALSPSCGCGKTSAVDTTINELQTIPSIIDNAH